MTRTAALLALALVSTHAPAAPDAGLWVLLSDNAGPTAPRWPTGCVYSYDKPPTNPADPGGRRLLDGDLPTADWTTCIGHNYEDLTVTFDLKQTRRLGKARVLMTMPQRPDAIRVAVRPGTDGEWREVGEIVPGPAAQTWHELALPELVPARQVRLTFKVTGWGFYAQEVELWGMSDGGTAARAVGSIVVGGEPGPKSVAAAYDLKYHLQAMTGQTWELLQGQAPAERPCAVVGPEAARAAGVFVPQGRWPKPEEVVLQTTGQQIILAGNDAGSYQGTACAVTILLEKLGCGWYGPDPLWQVVPKVGKLRWPPLNLRRQPSFAFRQLWHAPGDLPARWLQGGPAIRSGHAHDVICPPGELFATHPEYFALIGGKRTSTGEWQLCTSNPDVIRLAVEKARRWFDEHPENVAYSLSNNDCGGFCECAECAQTGPNPGARMLTFASAVQREVSRTHPGRHVCFLAYWYTLDAPPPGAKAEPGVIVMVVNEACHAHALPDPKCPPNAKWTANFQAWQATGCDLAIYEWYIPGANSPWGQKLPWVSGSVAARNLRYWQQQGVRYLTYESQPAYETTPSAPHPGYPLRWPLFYPAARMMWDTAVPAEDLLADACRKLYGPAAKAMLAYHLGWQQALEASPTHSRAWALPSPVDYLKPEAKARLTGLLDAADKAARTADPAVRQRLAADRELFDRAARTVAEMPETPAKTGE